jgi:ribonucleoside-diphosphate reductase alpha chain
MGATHAEKSTVKAGALNAVSADVVEAAPPKFCAIDDPECESCQ